MNQRGFSLVEMLVAVTILAIGLLALAGLQVTTIQANSHAAGVAEATGLAQAAVEHIQALNGDRVWFRETHESVELSELDDPALDDLVEILTDSGYQLFLDTTVNAGGVDNLTRIDLRVLSGHAVQKIGGRHAPRAVAVTVLKRYF